MFFSQQLIRALAALTSAPLLSLAAPLDCTAPPQQQSTLSTQKITSQESCCGYTITNRGNAYFRYQHMIDFSALTSADEIVAAGWEISNGGQGGALNEKTGQSPIASKNNVQIIPGEGIALKVPAQNKDAASFTSAEIVFPDVTLGGIWEIEAKLTAVKGTCMGFFTYHADHETLGWHDEQDIEILGVSLLAPATSPVPQPAGMQLTDYNPSNGDKSFMSSAFPQGVDPSKTFHTYGISWFPSTSSSNPAKNTEMRFDGKLMNSPKQYSSSHSSYMIFNHWSNGDDAWSAGPPNEEAVMIVKKVVAYYDIPVSVTEGSDVVKDTCDRAQACKVTI